MAVSNSAPCVRDRFTCYRRSDTANAKEIYAALTTPELPVQTSNASENTTDTGVSEKADGGILCRRSSDGDYSCYAHSVGDNSR